MSTNGLTVVRRWAGDAERWLTAFLEAAPRHSSIIAIVAMGSAVRERGHRRSDLDLLLIYEGERPLIKAPVEVDIRLVAVERIDHNIANGHEILGWALKHGTALYDPANIWVNLQRSWSERVPLPSATEAAKRGRQALARVKEMLEVEDESAADDLLLAALTQFARERLIRNGIFPASRPELPDQLREINEDDALAGILEKAMHDVSSVHDLMNELKATGFSH